MRYSEALKFLASTSWYGDKPGLRKIKALLDLLGRPQDKIPVIQVTGTNGKSTVVWATASILRAHGFKVGAYTSPHLNSYTERVLVNGYPISKQEFSSCLAKVIEAVEEVEKQEGMGSVTHFEVLTALAYLYFALAAVDVAVIEVGMGGRWDATSVVAPVVSVITNIALDHTDRLGTMLKKIAFEKSFVIKKGSWVVLGDLPREVDEVIKARMRKFAAPVVRYRAAVGGERRSRPASLKAGKLSSGGELFGPENIRQVEHGRASLLVFDQCGVRSDVRDVRSKLLGTHQVHNLSVALAAAESFLLCRGRALEEKAARKGVAETRSPGRLEVVSRQPLIVLDGAHNADGIRNLTAELKKTFKTRRVICLAAILKDKDTGAMMQALSEISDTLIISKNYFYRAADPEHLAVHVKGPAADKMVLEKDLRNAVRLAKEFTGPRDLMLVTGSLYTVGHVRHILGLGPLEN